MALQLSALTNIHFLMGGLIDAQNDVETLTELCKRPNPGNDPSAIRQLRIDINEILKLSANHSLSLRELRVILPERLEDRKQSVTALIKRLADFGVTIEKDDQPMKPIDPDLRLKS